MSTRIPEQTSTMVAKLIPRLATDHDGEVVATARAINRTLQSAGCDLHDLAKAVSERRDVRERLVYRDRPSAAPSSTSSPQSWSEMARWCHERRARLDERSANFVADMAARLWANDEPTERQGSWLKSIYGRLLRSEPAR